MGEGDILNSTTNVPQASSTDRCVSQPQIDLIGFNENLTGDQLETRIRTRSRGLPDHTDDRLRDDYTQLKVAVYEWGERVCSSAHSVDVIEREHKALCVQIEHTISEVLLRRGDYNLVGELGSLKDKLGVARKEAKQVTQSQTQPSQSQMSRRIIYDEGLNKHHSTEISMEGCSNEDLFVDDFIIVDEYLDSGNQTCPGSSREIVPGMLSQCWCAD